MSDFGNPYQRPDEHDNPFESFESNGERSETFESDIEPAPQWNWPMIVVSWLIILTVCFGMFGLYFVADSQTEERELKQFDLMQSNAMNRYSIGVAELFGIPEEDRKSLVGDVDGPVEQRFCRAILINELIGPEDAIEYLNEIQSLADKTDYEYTEQQASLNRTLRGLFADYQDEKWDGPSATESDKEQLRSIIGWSGELVLTPASSPDVEQRQELVDQAKTTAMTMIGFAIFIITMGLCGIVTLCLLVTMVVMKKLKVHFDDRQLYGGIYVETFALWLLAFLFCSLVGGMLVVSFGLPELAIGGMIMLSLSVLVWPIFRGVPVQTMLSDVGLRIGNPIKEVACGIVAYLAAMPFLAVAIMVVAILTTISTQMQTTHEFAPPNVPSHPIQEEIAVSDSYFPLLQIFVMACVVAPIVEEIVFRGLLYRHLRELSARKAFWASVTISTLINSLLFAMIHPQGLLGIPMLATLAAAFSLAREWRGSLLAPMTMHALNNSLVTCLLLIMR